MRTVQSQLRPVFGSILDRLSASDPGLVRLRMAVNAIASVSTTLAIEWGVAQALGQTAIIGMMFGAIVSMMSAMALSDPSWKEKLVTAAGIPIAAGSGLVAGILSGVQYNVSMAGFVAVMFVAVWVRRFGRRFFIYGFLAFMGYFFALIIHPSFSNLPYLLIAIVVATIWVFALRLTLLREDAAATLQHILHAFWLRGRMVAGASAALLDDPESERASTRLRSCLTRLTEAALLVDGQLAEPSAVANGRPPERVRGSAVAAELAFDEIATATFRLVDASEPHPASVRSRARTLLAALRDGDLPALRRELAALDNGQALDHPAMLHLTDAVQELVEVVRRWRRDPSSQPSSEAGEFTPALQLFAGNLPGTFATANAALDRQQAEMWNPLARLRLTTRQALQVALAGALAIWIGSLLSPQRYYWAVIAAFVAFTGTATTSETLTKSLNRVAGTLIGLVAAIALANLTAGHGVATLAIILVSMLLGFYLQRLSYAAMIFFITIMVAQMYTLLNQFTTGLMVLRLEETAIGAVIGVAVSLSLLPTSTRSTIRVARSQVLDSLADLLDVTAHKLADGQAADSLLAATRTVDTKLYQIVQLTRPLSSNLMFGADAPLVRHRVSILTACSMHARALVAAAGTSVALHSDALASAARQLADVCRTLGDRPSLSDGHAPKQLNAIRETLEGIRLTATDHADGADAIRMQLSRLCEALGRLTGGLAT